MVKLPTQKPTNLANWKRWETLEANFLAEKRPKFRKTTTKLRKKGETCRTKIAGNAEKIGKTSCDEWKNMVKFPQ